MAAPIVSGTTPPGPILFSPGQTKQVRINATDPDNGPAVTQRFVVKDAAGNQTPLAVTVQIQDQLTYSADPAPTGWTVTQVAGDPSLFNITAP